MATEPGSFAITERFSVVPALWGVAILSLGGAVMLQERPPGVALDIGWILQIHLVGLLFIAWDIVRRRHRATMHVRGEAVEVLRRGVCVASVQRVDMVPWNTRKNIADIGRGSILVLLMLLGGGLVMVLGDGSLKGVVFGGGIVALGLGTAASLGYMHFWHWTVDVRNAKSWMPWMQMMLTFRREDVRRLLDGENSTMPFLEIIRARVQGR